jgi:hypothetical protein
MDTEKLRPAIGPRADWYLARFEKIDRDGGGLTPGWNWPAFAFSTAWFTYRRLDGWASGNFLLLFFGAFATVLMQSLVVFVAVLLVAFVFIPLYANAIYYRSLKARLARAAADGEAAAAKLPRPPSAWTFVAAVLSSLLALFVPACVTVGPAAYADYGPRARVSEGVTIGASLKTPIAEFHAQEKRLPGAQEANKFRHAAEMKYATSVGWDPERKAIVVRMGERFEGKRFEFAAIEKGGTLEWVCRPIDLEPKYLPAACRN